MRENSATLRAVQNDSYPRIKSTLRTLMRSDGKLYVGNAREGFLLEPIPYLTILRSCNGVLSRADIAQRLFEPLPRIDHALEYLSSLGIIENLSQPDQRGQSQQHHLNSMERTRIESSLITHHSEDGGEEEWQARADLAISIFGDTRVARNLLALLSTSGFTECTIALAPHAEQLLQPRDINGLSVTTEHLAKNKALHHRDLIRQTRLGESSSAHQGITNLVITTAPPPAEQIQEWQSQGIDQLAISEVIAQEIEISPIIHPGMVPCLHCIALHRRDALPSDLTTLALAEKHHELPAPSAALIAAITTSIVANFQGSVHRSLPHQDRRDRLNYSLVINLLDPTLPIQRRSWNFHPECGCVDVRRRALPR